MTATVTATATEDLRQRFAAVLMETYADVAPDIALVQGQGCRVTDSDGKEYLDLAGGLSATLIGHAHPDVVAAIARQAGQLMHTSNQFLHEPEVELAERLRGLLSRDGRPGTAQARMFFCNSGTEANEAALKLVRRRQGPTRSVFVAAENAFHGRSTGPLALCGVPRVRDKYAPYGFEVRFVPFGDADALAAEVGADTAGVFLEPVLGEAGVVVPPDGYLRAAREICDRAGALLVIDEVQSGVGRSGRWFAYEHEDMVPDVITIAKGLAGGLPIGACIGIGDSSSGLGVGDHGSTFGGNPVACAAALAVLGVIERDGLLENCRRVGDRLAGGIASTRHPLLAGVRGRGLWRAVLLREPRGVEFSDAAARAGFLVSAVRPEAVRLTPPITLSPAEADEFVAALPAILTEAARS